LFYFRLPLCGRANKKAFRGWWPQNAFFQTAGALHYLAVRRRWLVKT
jgi:hypothetical protein